MWGFFLLYTFRTEYPMLWLFSLSPSPVPPGVVIVRRREYNPQHSPLPQFRDPEWNKPSVPHNATFSDSSWQPDCHWFPCSPGSSNPNTPGTSSSTSQHCLVSLDLGIALQMPGMVTRLWFCRKRIFLKVITCMLLQDQFLLLAVSFQEANRLHLKNRPLEELFRLLYYLQSEKSLPLLTGIYREVCEAAFFCLLTCSWIQKLQRKSVVDFLI